MSRRIFESYHTKQGAKFDKDGNLVLGPKDYSAQDEQLPARKREKVVHEPTPLSPMDEKLDLADKSRQQSTEEFLDFETRKYTSAAELQSGHLYMTRSKQTFLFLQGDMIFYSKIVPMDLIQKNGMKILQKNEYFLSGQKYVIVVCVNPAEEPVVLGMRDVGDDETPPIIDFMVIPQNFKKNPLIGLKAQADGEYIHIIEKGTKKEYFGVYVEAALTKSTEGEQPVYSYSGVLYPLRPTPNQLIPASRVEKVVPISDYLGSKS